jgi:hypothetical protein
MKVFLIGMPESGRTTMAQALCQDSAFQFIDFSWVKSSFRVQVPGEHPEQYHDAYHQWYISQLKARPSLCSDSVLTAIASYETGRSPSHHYVIDGVNSPKDFITLFDYNQDFAVFLNRTDHQEVKLKDYENIGVSVIRDYCFWLSSAGFLPRERWYEYNFKMTGGAIDRFRSMGSKNSVFIMGTLNRAIDHLQEKMKELV